MIRLPCLNLDTLKMNHIESSSFMHLWRKLIVFGTNDAAILLQMDSLSKGVIPVTNPMI